MQNTNDESLGKYERKIYSNPEWVIDRVGELVMSIEQALNCGEEKRGIFYPYETTADLELSDRTEDFKSSMIKLDKINQKAINKGVMHSKLYKNEKTGVVGSLSIFIDEFNIAHHDKSIDNEIVFDCFFAGRWNNIVLKINSQETDIEVDRFLYNLAAQDHFKGLGSYFMCFLKTISRKLNKPLHIAGYGSAKNFYLKEGFKEVKFIDSTYEGDLYWYP